MDLRIQILFLIKGFFKKLRILSSIVINDMGVYICDHADLRIPETTVPPKRRSKANELS
jgi:hypothetical protein